MTTKVSVIIPVYNVEDKLSRCVDSVLGQDFSLLEVILVDDGSTDSSGRICDEYARRDVRVHVFHLSNGGVSRARNAGIDQATGEYILFVDSDDYLETCCLSRLLSYRPVADLTYMSSNVHYHTGDVTAYHLRPLYVDTQGGIEEEILHLKENPQYYVYFGYTWNKLFRSDLIKQNRIRFIEGLSFYEDDAFTLEYLQYAKSLRTVPDALYHYIVSTTGLTARQNSCEEIVMLIHSNMKHLSFVANRDLLRHELGRMLTFYFQAIRLAQKQKRKEMYGKLVREAHAFCCKYLEPYQLPLRKAYRKKNFFLFRLNVALHKR